MGAPVTCSWQSIPSTREMRGGLSPLPRRGSLSPAPLVPLGPGKTLSPGVAGGRAAARLGTPRPRPAPGYSRAAGSSLSDNPSRWMSPSSMARPAARSGAPGRTGSRRGVTSSSCAPRARVSAPSSGREGTVPLLPRRRMRSCARGEPNLAARARALPLLPLSFLGWGVPSRPPAPRRIPAGTALAPPRAAQLRAVTRHRHGARSERAPARDAGD